MPDIRKSSDSYHIAVQKLSIEMASRRIALEMISLLFINSYFYHQEVSKIEMNRGLKSD